MRPLLTRVIDTNIFLDRPIDEVINSFDPCNIIIPIAVIKELDRFKTNIDETLRYHSRVASNFLDKARERGKLDKGVELESGHFIKVEINNFPNMVLPHVINTDDVDYTLLRIASLQSGDVLLMTQDTNLRILANTLGIPACRYGDDAPVSTPYCGWRILNAHVDDLATLSSTGKYYPEPAVLAGLNTNEYVILANECNPKQTMLGKYAGEEYVEVFRPSLSPVYGITPLNVEQKFFLDLLMNPAVSCVTALGSAGTGKTLLALAAAMEQTHRIGDYDRYQRIIVSRANIPFGKDIGFLPGTEHDKMAPWMGSVYDNLEFLLSSAGKDTAQRTIDMFIEDRRIDLRALTYMRGRSIPKQFIIIDEAQNITKDEIKTIVSRAGKDTKVVVMGDVEQIDNCRLSSRNNGLVHLINSFRGLPFFGHVTLTKTERSELANAAAKLL